MSQNVYDVISYIALNNEDGRIECRHVIDFDEICDEITFTTEVPLEDLQRGWVGDMFVHMRGLRLIDMSDNVMTTKSINNVLLSKLTVSCEPGSVVRWRYTFLKD